MGSRIVFIVAFWLFSAIRPAFSQNAYSLKRTLQTARVNNPVLKAQFYNVSLSEGDIVTAKLRPNPILNNQSLQLLSPTYFPPNTTWSDGKNRQVWWQLTKPFQLPAQRRYKIDFAEKSFLLSLQLYGETERNLLGEVANKWIVVWTSKKLLDILQLAKNNVDSFVYINKVLLKNLAITETDMNRTELLSSEYEIKIKSAQQTFNNESANLKLLLGVGEEVKIDTSFAFPDLAIAENVDSLLEQAVINRPDILSIKSSIDAAASNIKLQKALAWPTPELGVIYNPQNTIPYAGFFGTIQIPLFARNQGEIKKSQIARQQSEQTLFYTQQQIQTDITNAYNTYQTEKTNLKSFGLLMTKSDQILKSVKYAYRHNGTTVLDYLLAQRSWLETQQQYYTTLQTYMQSYIRLLYVSGSIGQLAK